MGHVVAGVYENPEIVVHSDYLSAPCRIGRGASRAPLAGRLPEPSPERGRAVRLRLAAALLATPLLASICASEAKAGALDVEKDHSSQVGETSAPPDRSLTGAAENLQKLLDQQHRRADLLGRTLTTVGHLQMLLTLEKARLESAKLRNLSESEYADSIKSLQQDGERVEHAAESGVAELCKSMKDDPAEHLVQDLAAARRDVETQTALAAKANDEIAKLKQAADGSAAELRKSLQQEQERAGRLEQELAAARREVETQTALAAKASDEVSQVKQAADGSAAELRKSLQQEQERAGRLEQELAAARREVETQTALAAKASDEVSQAKQAADGNAAELRKSLQQEQERAGRLEQELAAARREVEMQTALATKASDETNQAKQAAEQGSAELRQSLQKEQKRAEALAQELSMAHTAIYAYEAQARKAAGEPAAPQQISQNSAAALEKSVQQEQERASRLEQDLAAARRDLETQTALVAKANENAARVKQAAEHDAAELQGSLKKEHDRAEALARNLSMMHTAIYAYEVQTRMASDQAKGRRQAEQSAAAELLRQEREKIARLERELQSAQQTTNVPAVAPAITTGRVTQDPQPGANAIRPGATAQTSIAATRTNARPDPVNAAEAARLVARASVLLGQGDIGSARSVLERAVDAGDAQASFALAETYDPLILRRWGAYGTLGDAARARDLYARAQAGGIKEARERLDALRR